MKIFKYRLNTGLTQVLTTPGHTTFLKAGLDPTGAPVVWAIVDPSSNETTNWCFKLRWTLEGSPDAAVFNYLDTFEKKKHVYHVFYSKL